MGKNKKAHLLKVIENKYQQELQKRTENILKLDSELSHMKHKEKRLVDLLISDKISQEMFEQTSKEIEDSKKDIQDKIARYDIRIEEFFSNMKKIVKIAEISQKMFKSSSFLKKRALLKTITSNFFTDGKNAVISIRKPFEICLQRVSCPTWLTFLDFLLTKSPEEVLSLTPMLNEFDEDIKNEEDC